MMKIISNAFALTALLLASSGPAIAAGGEAQDLSWQQLVPAEAAADNLKTKGFLAGRKPGGAPGTPPGGAFGYPATPGAPANANPGADTPFGGGGADGVPPPQANDAPWMSMRSQQPGGEDQPKVVAELDGKRVRIGGYVVPLDFDATRITEFLLVPFVGACIHVPPPPPNQVIYVKAAEGFEVQGQFDPVYVTGTIKTARQVTGLAATGYTMEADTVATRKE
jgi:hypothetical protein